MHPLDLNTCWALAGSQRLNVCEPNSWVKKLKTKSTGQIIFTSVAAPTFMVECAGGHFSKRNWQVCIVGVVFRPGRWALSWDRGQNPEVALFWQAGGAHFQKNSHFNFKWNNWSDCLRTSHEEVGTFWRFPRGSGLSTGETTPKWLKKG